MASMTCPACTRRFAGLIASDCTVCAGVGVLTLGNAALHKTEPEAVAFGVQLYLEWSARRGHEQIPASETRAEDLLDVVRTAVAELRHGGMLAATTTAAAAPEPVADVEPVRRRHLTAVPDIAPDRFHLSQLVNRSRLRMVDVVDAHRDDLERDLLGWSLTTRHAGQTRTTALPDDLATSLLSTASPDGWLFPSLRDQDVAHAG